MRMLLPQELPAVTLDPDPDRHHRRGLHGCFAAGGTRLGAGLPPSRTRDGQHVDNAHLRHLSGHCQHSRHSLENRHATYSHSPRASCGSRRLQGRSGSSGRAVGPDGRRRPKRIDDDRQAVGEVKPRYESDLSFRVAGKVLVRLVDVGAWVKQGDTLATLDTQDYQNRLRSAEADVASAEAALVEAQGDGGAPRPSS